MSYKITHLWAFLVGVLVCHSMAHASTVANTKQARASFDKGVNFYAAGSYRDALAAFEEAYRLKPHPAVKVNIANCHERLGEPLEAIQSFQDFLNDSSSELKPSQRIDVQLAIDRLKRQIGQIQLKVWPIDAEIFVDGNVPTKDAEGAALVNPGMHRIMVRRDGYISQRREVPVSPGQQVTLNVRLVTTESAIDRSNENPSTLQPEGASEASLLSEKSSNSKKITTPVLITGGLALGLGAGALVTGLMALKANSDFDKAVSDSNNPTLSDGVRQRAVQDGKNSADKASHMATATDVLLGGALVSAGAALFLFFSQDPNSQDKRASTGFSIRPRIYSGGAGVVLRTQF